MNLVGMPVVEIDNIWLEFTRLRDIDTGIQASKGIKKPF